MTTQANDFLMQAWKQQVECNMRMMEALVEGATRLREMQLDAAAGAHADLEATRKAIAATNDPSRLVELQAQWTRANAEKCATYWRKFYDVTAQTQASLVQCMVPTGAVAAAPAGDSKEALLSLMDSAYKQWLHTAQQFYKLPPMPAQTKAQQKTAV